MPNETILIFGLLALIAAAVIIAALRQTEEDEYPTEYVPRHPFKRGDLVSNGRHRVIVNAAFKDNQGRPRMLVDTFLWDDDKYIAQWCKEVSCAGYYKIR